MSSHYDRLEMFRFISCYYASGESGTSFCRKYDFPIKTFYRWRTRYDQENGSGPLAGVAAEPVIVPVRQNNVGSSDFISLDLPKGEPSVNTESVMGRTGLCLSLSGGLCLDFEDLPPLSYLLELLKSVSNDSSQ